MLKKRGNSRFLLFKIDLEKTYDMVDWNFLQLTLSEFGFPPPIIKLIMNFTTSTSLSDKWNNEMPEIFSPKRGLR